MIRVSIELLIVLAIVLTVCLFAIVALVSQNLWLICVAIAGVILYKEHKDKKRRGIVKR